MALSAFCCAYYLAAALAIVVGLHRGLTHGAVKFRFGFGRLLLFLALPAGTPLQWAGTHRHHHASADQPDDPHSPWQGGFWHAHCGWYLGSPRPWICMLYALAGPVRILIDAWHRPRSNQQFNGLAPDVAADAWLDRFSRPRPYAAAMACHLLPFAFAWATWGLSGLVALWLTLVVVYNSGDAVNSAGHLWGVRDPEGRTQARNHPALAWAAFGDGWHANHHRFPDLARAGMGKEQLDIGWLTIRWLRRVGLAVQVRGREQAGLARQPLKEKAAA